MKKMQVFVRRTVGFLTILFLGVLGYYWLSQLRFASGSIAGEGISATRATAGMLPTIATNRETKIPSTPNLPTPFPTATTFIQLSNAVNEVLWLDNCARIQTDPCGSSTVEGFQPLREVINNVGGELVFGAPDDFYGLMTYATVIANFCGHAGSYLPQLRSYITNGGSVIALGDEFCRAVPPSGLTSGQTANLLTRDWGIEFSSQEVEAQNSRMHLLSSPIANIGVHLTIYRFTPLKLTGTAIHSLAISDNGDIFSALFDGDGTLAVIPNSQFHQQIDVSDDRFRMWGSLISFLMDAARAKVQVDLTTPNAFPTVTPYVDPTLYPTSTPIIVTTPTPLPPPIDTPTPFAAVASSPYVSIINVSPPNQTQIVGQPFNFDFEYHLPASAQAPQAVIMFDLIPVLGDNQYGNEPYAVFTPFGLTILEQTDAPNRRQIEAMPALGVVDWEVQTTLALRVRLMSYSDEGDNSELLFQNIFPDFSYAMDNWLEKTPVPLPTPSLTPTPEGQSVSPLPNVTLPPDVTPTGTPTPASTPISSPRVAVLNVSPAAETHIEGDETFVFEFEYYLPASAGSSQVLVLIDLVPDLGNHNYGNEPYAIFTPLEIALIEPSNEPVLRQVVAMPALGAAEWDDTALLALRIRLMSYSAYAGIGATILNITFPEYTYTMENWALALPTPPPSPESSE